MDGNVIAPLNPLATVQLPSTYEEYAGFGNATWRVTDRFWVTGGLRWAHNNQTFRQISAGAIVPAANDPGASSESAWTDRKSDGWGKSVSERVDIGGRRNMKK